MISECSVVRLLKQRFLKQTDCATYLGPFLGEFGHELIYWQGFVRWYANSHPNEYIIAAGRPGHSFLYESVDEYHELHFNGPVESNGCLPIGGIDRFSYLGLLNSLNRDDSLGDLLLEPNSLVANGWIEFGRPLFHQEFIPLESKYEDLVGEPYVIFYPRNRTFSPEKNSSNVLISNLVKTLSNFGLRVVIGGGLEIREDIPGTLDSRTLFEKFSLKEKDWTEFQVGLVQHSRLLISGESGSGFLATLCDRPALIFGSEREKKRYTETENIFSVPMRYICSREPSIEELQRSLGELNEYIQE